MKIAFVIGDDGPTFVNPIIEFLIHRGHTCKTFSAYGDLWLDEFDLVWCEWCSSNAATVSKFRRKSKVLIRLHRYEAATQWAKMVRWDHVDCLLTVGNPYVQKILYQTAPHSISVRSESIPNGIDMDKFPLQVKDTCKIAFIGNIREVKNPMRMVDAIQSMNSYLQKEEQLSCHIAGKIDDPWLYEAMLRRIDCSDLPIYFDGWQSDLVSWLADKSYVICTSTIESQGVANLQAMATGCMPIIIGFPGSSMIYPTAYVYRHPNIDPTHFCRQPELYREFVAERYDNRMILPRVEKLLKEITNENA